MMLEVKKSLPVDIAVCAAAVSDFKPRVKKKLKPTGFILNYENLYVSTNLGKLLIVSVENATVNEIIKVI